MNATMTRAVALASLLLLGACGTPKPPPQTPKAPAPAPAAAEPEAGSTGGAPTPSVPINELAPNDDKEVRVAGVVSRVFGMRLVPPKVIFEVRDSSGTVKVVLNEKARLTEGQKIEIVGHYKSIPDPMYTGPGDAPQEPVLVVDRFIAF